MIGRASHLYHEFILMLSAYRRPYRCRHMFSGMRTMLLLIGRRCRSICDGIFLMISGMRWSSQPCHYAHDATMARANCRRRYLIYSLTRHESRRFNAAAIYDDTRRARALPRRACIIRRRYRIVARCREARDGRLICFRRFKILAGHMAAPRRVPPR